MSVVVLRHFHVVFDVDVLDLNLSNTLAARTSKVENVKAYFIWTLSIKHTLAYILTDQLILTKNEKRKCI